MNSLSFKPELPADAVAQRTAEWASLTTEQVAARLRRIGDDPRVRYVVASTSSTTHDPEFAMACRAIVPLGSSGWLIGLVVPGLGLLYAFALTLSEACARLELVVAKMLSGRAEGQG